MPLNPMTASGTPRTALVTGGAGFVAGHLARELESAGCRVALTDSAPAPNCRRVDLTDAAGVRALVAEVRPEAIVHLGAISFVPDAARDPDLLERVNVGGTRNLLEAMLLAKLPRRAERRPAFLFVSTAQIELRPLSPYAASKLAAEKVVAEFGGKGIDAVVARPANHTGPGQSPRFVVPSFVRQALEIKAGVRPRFTVGNLDAVRDFTDVRDVARAYRLLLERGAAGATYGIGSRGRLAMRELLRKIAALAGIPEDHEVDPALWRPADASPETDAAAVRALGWSPRLTLGETLADMLTAGL